MSRLEQWRKDLREVAIKEFNFTPESADSIDMEAYDTYYINNYTPFEALAEDATNA